MDLDVTSLSGAYIGRMVRLSNPEGDALRGQLLAVSHRQADDPSDPRTVTVLRLAVFGGTAKVVVPYPRTNVFIEQRAD